MVTTDKTRIAQDKAKDNNGAASWGGDGLAVPGSTGGDRLSDSSPIPQGAAPFVQGAGSRSLPGVPMGGGGGTAGGVRGLSLSSTSSRKRSKVAKLARRWAWLKGAGGYLDIVPYYFSTEPENLRTKLEYCQHTWYRERKGDDIRWRGIGCGERDVCPVCGSYRQLVLAREASEAMLLAQSGVEVGGAQLEGYGFKLVLTIPKAESARIDALLYSDYSGWQAEVGRLFKAAYAFVGRWFGKGCGGVVSLDYAGERALADAHYHINIYVFPARRDGKSWVPLAHWIDKDGLADMRAGWTEVVNEMYGFQLKETNFKANYLGTEGQFRHWLQYLYRHSLADLWRGWQGVDVGGLRDDVKVKYKPGKRGRVMKLSSDDMQRVADRLRSIPSHFKRIRWFGVFSDGQRAKTMESLGLEAVEVKAEDDDAWVQEGEPARFVRYEADGVVLRTDEGDEFFVPDKLVDYRPSKVSIGKRKRWREPGSR